MEANWRPLFWEPVEGTGERLMAGVILCFDGQWVAQRMLRDDVLENLYGKAASNPKRLIDAALDTYLSVAKQSGFQALSELSAPILGLHAGAPRTTDALSMGDAIRHAVLLHSSLACLDGWDELEETDSPAAEEVNKHFATEVKDAVIAKRPDLANYFGRSARLIHGGRLVRFGFFSGRAVLHFSVIHAVRQSASVRDARARLWELSRAREIANISTAGLVSWLPSDDDPTLGRGQREQLRLNRSEVESEAKVVNLSFHPVSSAEQARDRVIELAA